MRGRSSSRLAWIALERDRDLFSFPFSSGAHADSLDWKDISTQQIVERINRNVKSGSIILFHNNAQHVLEYLPQILDNLKENGYEVVKIDDLIYHDHYHIDNNGIQISDADPDESGGSSASESDENSEAASKDQPSAAPEDPISEDGAAEDNRNASFAEKGA